MKPDLSIIMPCYNCESTVEEAVASCFTQELTVPFEIVMVDDGSTDGTRDVLARLAQKHDNIRLVFHEMNRGGGAARNTAVRNAEADIIFCLDSDDLLPASSLSKMYAFIREKRCDGVGISMSTKFKGTDITDIAYVNTMGRPGEAIAFESLLFETAEEMCPLYSTFMHTKEAFEIAGGYPENQGFDTQGFAWRFLANGLSAFTCPNAAYLHRVGYNRSYYIREYESGRANYNWASIFGEFLYLFRPEVQEIILSFNFKDYARNLGNMIKAFKQPFAEDYREKIVRRGRDKMQTELRAKAPNELSRFEAYWLGGELLNRGDFATALAYLDYALSHGAKYEVVQEKADMARLCFAGASLREAWKAVESRRAYVTLGSLAPWWKRQVQRVRRRGMKLLRRLKLAT